MRPARIQLAIGVAWVLFWGLMVTVAVQDYLRDGGTAIWQPVLWESSSMVTATILLLAQRRITRRYDHLLGAPWRWFAVRALLLPLFCAAFVPIAFGIRHGVYALLGEAYAHAGWGETLFYESLKLTIFVSMFALIEFGILSWLALLDEKLRASATQALLRQAQLNHLGRQMQPHFLFNALNTVSSLMHTDVEQADALLVQLADLLRASLEAGDAAEAPLALELKLARGYARIMETRYAGRVQIDWDIDATLLGCRAPVMSVQPLLENVFKHTVERRRDCTRIAVRARRDGAMLVLAVEDDAGILPTDAPSGIGLANLRERLAVLHGDGARLLLRQLHPAGVLAELRLPCAC